MVHPAADAKHAVRTCLGPVKPRALGQCDLREAMRCGITMVTCRDVRHWRSVVLSTDRLMFSLAVVIVMVLVFATVAPLTISEPRSRARQLLSVCVGSTTHLLHTA